MSIEAQYYVLGCLFQKPDLMEECYVQPEEFSPEAEYDLSLIMKYMQYTYEQDGTIDPALMAQRSGKRMERMGGFTFLMKLRDAVPDLNNFSYYQSLVRDAHIQKQMYELLQETAATGMDITEVKSRIEEIEATRVDNKGTGFVHMADLLQDHAGVILKRNNMSGLTGAKTACEDLNKLGGGHQPGDLVIVAARPSMGKTQYVLNDVAAVTEAGWAALIISLEQDAIQIIERQVCLMGGLKNQRVKSGQMTETDWEKYSHAVSMIADRDIYIDDTPGSTVEYVRRKAKEFKKKFPKFVLYVDYLQFLNTERKFSKNNEAKGYITKVLKDIARKMQIPVVAISAVGRDVEKRPDKRPLMSDLRESGDIESDADIVMFLYRDDYYNPNAVKKGMTEIIIAKGRNIGVGTFEMMFRSDTGQFINLTDDEKKEYAEKVKLYEQTKGHRK